MSSCMKLLVVHCDTVCNSSIAMSCLFSTEAPRETTAESDPLSEPRFAPVLRDRIREEEVDVAYRASYQISFT